MNMTREEQAIVYFKDMRKRMCEDYLKICPKDSVAYRATLIEKGFYDDAIKALKQEPIKNHLGVDCISREQALDLLCKKCPVYNCIRKCVSYKAIEKMSSVTPIRPKGHWIDHSDEGYVECPKCGSATNCDGNISDLHFCFSCGAEMEEVKV